MKYIIKGILLSGAIISSINKSSTTNSYIIVPITVYGAFDGTKDATIGCFISNYTAGLKMTIEYYNTQFNTRFMVQSVNIDDSIDRAHRRFSIQLYLKDNLTANGLKLNLYLGSSLNPLWNTSFTLYPKISETINTKLFKKKNYVIKSTLLTSSNWITDEVYDFSNTLDYISDNNDNSLNISECCFIHSPVVTNIDSYGESFLVIEDVHNIYQFIDKDINNSIKIPINIINNKEVYSFSFKNLMYVNPNNLQMSFVEQKGFIETNKFYIPFGLQEKLKDSEIYCELNRIGLNKTTVKLPLSYTEGKSLFGNCYDSTYCIQGEVKK